MWFVDVVDHIAKDRSFFSILDNLLFLEELQVELQTHVVQGINLPLVAKPPNFFALFLLQHIPLIWADFTKFQADPNNVSRGNVPENRQTVQGTENSEKY